MGARGKFRHGVMGKTGPHSSFPRRRESIGVVTAKSPTVACMRELGDTKRFPDPNRQSMRPCRLPGRLRHRPMDSQYATRTCDRPCLSCIHILEAPTKPRFHPVSPTLPTTSQEKIIYTHKQFEKMESRNFESQRSNILVQACLEIQILDPHSFRSNYLEEYLHQVSQQT